MKKPALSLLLVIFLFTGAKATHNRGGEITYRHISGYTYEVTITTYTKTSSIAADRPTLDSVYWGDGAQSMFSRQSRTNIGNDVSVNVYINQHTYPGMGWYTVYLEDPMRNEGSCNVPNSVNVPFSITCSFVAFDPALYCTNNSVSFANVPILSAQLGKDYKMNIAAVDVDNDSLSYQLIPCLGAGHVPAPGYTLPPAVSVNPINGEFIWEAAGMSFVCQYNFAVQVNEWRKGYHIASTERDFQITMVPPADTSYSFLGTSTYPADSLGNFVDTVMVGDTLNIPVAFSHPAGTPALTACGKAFSLPNSPTFTTTTVAGTAFGALQWIPDSDKISHNPYVFIFRGNSLYGQEDLTYSVYVPGITTDTCPAFPFVFVPELENPGLSFQLFPNPAVHSFTIKGLSPNETSLLEVFNPLGEIVYKEKISGKKECVVDADFAKGIYFVRVNKAVRTLVVQ